jgi:hypothetical protein
MMLDASWSPLEAAEAAVSFAKDYAAVVEADWRTFLDARGRIAQQLGL